MIIENLDHPCTVGLDMEFGCPLVVSNWPGAERVLRDIKQVLEFRKLNSDDVAEPKRPHTTTGGINLIIVEDEGMRYGLRELRPRSAGDGD